MPAPDGTPTREITPDRVDPPVFPGYAPLGPYYDYDEDGEDDERQQATRDRYHDQFDPELPQGGSGQVILVTQQGREWVGDVDAQGFMGQPPPGTWVMESVGMSVMEPTPRPDPTGADDRTLDAVLHMALFDPEACVALSALSGRYKTLEDDGNWKLVPRYASDPAAAETAIKKLGERAEGGHEWSVDLNYTRQCEPEGWRAKVYVPGGSLDAVGTSLAQAACRAIVRALAAYRDPATLAALALLSAPAGAAPPEDG